MTRYHPLIVTLHWLLALMIILALFGGNFLLEPMPNSDPAKLDGLRAHMTIGIAIGALMLIRLITRFATTLPPHADTGNRLLNIAGQVAHWGLYLLVFAMVSTGLGIAQFAGLPAIVFGGEGALPATFDDLPPRAAHGVFGILLVLLILGHIAGWLYHLVFVKDRLLSRMWFGKRSQG